MKLKMKKARNKFLINNEDFDAINFYWQKIMQNNYLLIINLAQALLSLSHSSAAIERAFSQLKLIKTENKSNLANDTLESLMIAKINKINLDDPTTMKSLHAYYEKKQVLKKRKIDWITTPSQDKIVFQIIQQSMDMESNTINNNSQNLLNEIKIEDSSSPSHEYINIWDLTLPGISYFILLFILIFWNRGREFNN